MRSRTLGGLFLLLAAATCATAAEAVPIERASAWERDASNWAVETFQKALAARPDEAARIRKEMDAKRKTFLPADIVQANEADGLVVFARPMQFFIKRVEAPKATETAVDGVSLELARDEWESAQLGVWALRDIDNFSYSISDLVHSSGRHKIGGADVRALYGMHIWVAGKKNPETGKAPYSETPGALVDLESVNIPKHEALGLWIDIYAPKDAKAGVYRGEITLKVAGRAIRSIPLAVTVRPFVLDQNNQWQRGAFMSKFRTRKELMQMRENGMNLVSWWTSAGYTLELKDGKIVTDFSAYQEYLKLLDRVGYTGRHAVFIGGTGPKIANRIFKILGRAELDPSDRNARKQWVESDLSAPFGEYYIEALRQLHEQMKAVGHGDLPFCLLDEPDLRPRPQRRNWYIKMIDMVEKALPEFPLYGVFYHAGDEDRLSHGHVIWCSNRPADRISRFCSQAGKSLWTYGSGNYYTVEGKHVRFRFGTIPWVFGADGSYLWANYWNRGNIFDPWTNPGGATFSLRTKHGPLSSPMQKGIREGIDDRRYFATLEKLIAKAQLSGSDAAKAEAAGHLAFLDSFRKPLRLKMFVAGGRPNFKKLGRLEITGLDGATGVLDLDENLTWAFAEFVRKDVAKRIVLLKASLK